MHVLIVTVGEDKRDPFVEQAYAYIAKSQTAFKVQARSVQEQKRASQDDNKVKVEEGKHLLAATTRCFRVALDERGQQFTSTDFAKKLQSWIMLGRPVSFLIGGATGLSQEVVDAADVRMSLSHMTLPHRLAFCVIAEQIYRAGEIMRGGPYHKA